MKTKPLPDKLSDLIRVAVDDFSKVLADERYEVNLKRWHYGMRQDDKCTVCVAGAIIARSFKAGPEKDFSPYHFDEEIRSKLFAVDSVRSGQIWEAVYLFHKTCPAAFRDVRIPPANPSDLPAWLSAIADELSAAGL